MGIIMHDGIQYTGGGGGAEAIELTTAEYNALSTEEKHDPNKVYYVTDMNPGGGGGVEIDDTTISASKVWSSQKVNAEIPKYERYSTVKDLSSPITFNEATGGVDLSISESDVRSMFNIPSDIATDALQTWINTHDIITNIDAATNSYSLNSYCNCSWDGKCTLVNHSDNIFCLFHVNIFNPRETSFTITKCKITFYRLVSA